MCLGTCKGQDKPPANQLIFVAPPALRFSWPPSLLRSRLHPEADSPGYFLNFHLTSSCSHHLLQGQLAASPPKFLSTLSPANLVSGLLLGKLSSTDDLLWNIYYFDPWMLFACPPSKGQFFHI